MNWMLAAALLLSPLTAVAQPPKSAPAPAPPAVAPAPAVAPGPPAADDDFAWVDELFGPDDSPLAFDMAIEAHEGHGDGLMAFDDGGPDGPRHVRRVKIGGPHGRGMMMRHGVARRFAALDLTDTQRDKLRDIHEASARKSVQRRADIQLARMDLRKLMRADSPNAASVNSQIDKIARLQADGMKAHYDTFLQARAVLTPEQQKKLRSGGGPMEHEQHD
jgi:Spy/CpxP family protein refolding chaperone